MAESVQGTFETKKINELTSLSKLKGREELLIDDGITNYRITVDTLLGYIRDQINNNTSSGGSAEPAAASVIHVIKRGEPNIPASARPDGHYYIRIVQARDAQLASGLPRTVKVSPNMRLRMIED